MKLLRVGVKGKEKPAALDKNGKIVGIEFLTLDVPDDLVNSLILFDELKDESELLNKLIETSRAAAGN